jgi:hypothetical protein
MQEQKSNNKRDRESSTMLLPSLSTLRMKLSNGGSKSIQEIGENRCKNSKEQYYTRVRIARECIRAHLIPILEKAELHFDRIVEPSCGRGAFLKAIDSECKFAGCLIDAFDIDPQHPRVEKRDFLLDTPNYDNKRESILVVGNFPFGQKNVLVRRFVQRCCFFAAVIAVILPKSFKKPSKRSMQNAFDKCWWLEHSFDLPKNSFRTNGKVHDVNCVFQVWIKKSTPRIIPPLPKPTRFCYVKDWMEADIAIRRNNGSAGKALWDLRDLKTKPRGNFFLIRFQVEGNVLQQQQHLHLREFFCHLFNMFSWPSASNTVGRKSLCQYEMTERIDETIQQILNSVPSK